MKFLSHAVEELKNDKRRFEKRPKILASKKDRKLKANSTLSKFITGQFICSILFPQFCFCNLFIIFCYPVCSVISSGSAFGRKSVEVCLVLFLPSRSSFDLSKNHQAKKDVLSQQITVPPQTSGMTDNKKNKTEQNRTK